MRQRISSIILIFSIIIGASLSRTINSPQTTDCSYSSSNYTLDWSYDEISNDIVFKLVARSKFENFYTAVAFGDEEPDDVISVFVRAGQIGLIDGHLASDGAIESDEKTNVQALQFDLEDGLLSAQFARPIETTDSQDADLSNCITMFLPLETHEIITGAPLELGSALHKLRVCDLPITCATKSHNEIVKRQEAPVCSSTSDEKAKNRIDWTTNEDSERVTFTIKQTSKKGRLWTAIGIGESMDDMNMIVAFVENGRLKKQGLYRTEGKMTPYGMDGYGLKKESATLKNNVVDIVLSVEKTFLTTRTNSEGCIPLQISIQGGNYKPDYTIGKHKTRPETIMVCSLDSCESTTDSKTDQKSTKAIPIVGDDAEEETLGLVKTTKKPESEFNTDVEGSGVDGAIGETVEGSGSAPIPTEEVMVSSSAGVDPLVNERPLTGNNIEDEAPKTSQNIDSGATTLENNADAVDKTGTTASASAASAGCGPDHVDLKVCESYFAEYIGKVTQWSDKHQMKVSAHMWKACTLLSQVQHVTTMCCTIFRSTCATHLNL